MEPFRPIQGLPPTAVSSRVHCLHCRQQHLLTCTLGYIPTLHIWRPHMLDHLLQQSQVTVPLHALLTCTDYCIGSSSRQFASVNAEPSPPSVQRLHRQPTANSQPATASRRPMDASRLPAAGRRRWTQTAGRCRPGSSIFHSTRCSKALCVP